MSMKINKQNAIDLVTPVADGEASEEETIALYFFMEKNPDVRQLYDDVLWIKRLVRTKAPRYRIPERLRVKIRNHIETISGEPFG